MYKYSSSRRGPGPIRTQVWLPPADPYNLPLRLGPMGRRVAPQQPLSWSDLLNHLHRYKVVVVVIVVGRKKRGSAAGAVKDKAAGPKGIYNHNNNTTTAATTTTTMSDNRNKSSNRTNIFANTAGSQVLQSSESSCHTSDTRLRSLHAAAAGLLGLGAQ